MVRLCARLCEALGLDAHLEAYASLAPPDAHLVRVRVRGRL